MPVFLVYKRTIPADDLLKQETEVNFVVYAALPTGLVTTATILRNADICPREIEEC